MVNCFDSLRFNPIVSSDDQDGNIGNLGSPGPHSRECFMAGRIEKYNFFPGDLYLISSDMLGNAPGFTGGDISLANSIQERCFSVVNMTEHRDHRMAFDQLFVADFLFAEQLLLDRVGDKFNIQVILIGHQLDHFGTKGLVNIGNNTQIEEPGDQFGRSDLEMSGYLADSSAALNSYLPPLFLHRGLFLR